MERAKTLIWTPKRRSAIPKSCHCGPREALERRMKSAPDVRRSGFSPRSKGALDETATTKKADRWRVGFRLGLRICALPELSLWRRIELRECCAPCHSRDVQQMFCRTRSH